MAFKTIRDFIFDYPGGYSKLGYVYDGRDKLIGYVDSNCNYCINDGSSRNDQVYDITM